MNKDEVLRYAGQKLMELGNNGDRNKFRRQMQEVINSHSKQQHLPILIKKRRIMIEF